MEYLINVGMSLAPKLIIIFVVWAVVYFVLRYIKKNLIKNGFFDDKQKEWHRLLHKLTTIFFSFSSVLVIVLSLFTSTNTWKNETFDRKLGSSVVSEQMRSENLNSERTIVDRTRQPELSNEERSERFDNLIKYK